MKAVKLYDGGSAKVVAAAKIDAGDVVVQSGLVGIAPYPIASGATGVVELEGIYRMAYYGSGAAAVGAKAYWDATNNVVTTVSSGNTALGLFVEAATSGGSLCVVKIN